MCYETYGTHHTTGMADVNMFASRIDKYNDNQEANKILINFID